MSKAVMISIQPKWAAKIANGEKTIEVRKTRPKLNTPFKCYIYETKQPEKSFISRTIDGVKTSVIVSPKGRGKVIGEFVCDRIEPIACHKRNNGVGFDYLYYTESIDALTDKTQLTDFEMQQYLGCEEDGECVGYGWHISDLVIYDKPKELSEFRKPCKHNCECDDCKYWGYQYVKNGGVELVCPTDEPITRPSQSWCYIEEA